MSTSSILSVPLGISQMAAGIGGFRRSLEFADLMQDARREDVRARRRQGLVRDALIRTQTAISGVEISSGSPLENLRQNAVMTNEATQRIFFNYELRRERALAEGLADLSTGIGSGLSTFLGGVQDFADFNSGKPLTLPGPGQSVNDEFSLLQPLDPDFMDF